MDLPSSNDLPLSDSSDDDRKLYEEIEVLTFPVRFITNERQCPHCEAHLFPGTVIHKCQVVYFLTTLEGKEDFLNIREDKIRSKGSLFLLFNQDENGYKSYFVETGCNDRTYEPVERSDFIAMLQQT